MSLVSSRLNLTHRCMIERDSADSPGDDGWENQPTWESHLTDLPCRFWARGGRETVVNAEAVVPVDDLTLIVPLGTDVTEKDRVSGITFRGDTIIAGPVGIREVNPRRDHLELALVRAG